MTKDCIRLEDGSLLPLDERGYLLEPESWTPEVSLIMARADGLQLEPDHWRILEIFRDYYSRFEVEPPMRALVKAAREKLGADKANSRYLYRLFPEGPGTQACRYAGLPRPVSCI